MIETREYTDVHRKMIEMHEIAGRIYRENLAGESGAKARSYLASRGITPGLAAEFGIGVSLGRTKPLHEAAALRYGPDGGLGAVLEAVGWSIAGPLAGPADDPDSGCFR